MLLLSENELSKLRAENGALTEELAQCQVRKISSMISK